MVGLYDAIVKLSVPVALFFVLFLLLIWDIGKVKDLSDVIHDDHHAIWEQMNLSELREWYSPLELCMLRANDSVNVRSYRNQSCSNYTASSGASHKKMFCGVGSSLGRICSAPLLARKYYTARLRNDEYSNPSGSTLKIFLRRVAAVNKTLVFLGDAISKQNQEAMICEILRTDRAYVTWSESGPYFNYSVSRITINWRDDPSRRLRVVFAHMAHVHDSGKSVTDAHDRAFDEDKGFHIENSDASGWGVNSAQKEDGKDTEDANSQKAIVLNWTDPGSQPVAASFSKPVRFTKSSPAYGALGTRCRAYGKSCSSLSLDEATTLLEHLEDSSGGVVLVANIGVWYNTRDRFRRELLDFLNMLSSFGERNLVFFRETSAQHWNHTGHGYFEDGGIPMAEGCSPLLDATPEFDWRNADVYHTIENEGFKNINMIPFRDITAPLYAMHPDGLESRDCTRFCYFPQMWGSVWHALEKGSRNSSKLSYRPPRNATARF